MNARFILPCVVLALSAPSVAVSAQDAATPPASTPAVKTTPEIKSKAVADFYKRHQNAKTISFTAAYYTLSGVDVGFMQQNTYAVQARRLNLFAVRGGPNLMRMPEEGYDKGHLIYMDNPLTVCVSDGKSLVEMSPRFHFYQKSPAPARFSQTPTAIWCVEGGTALSTEMLYGFTPAQDEQVYGTHTIVFTQANPYNPPRVEVEKLYFAADTGELIRYSDFVQNKDSLDEIKRVEYSDWKFNSRLPRDTFTLALPADAKQISAVTGKLIAAPTPKKH